MIKRMKFLKVFVVGMMLGTVGTASAATETKLLFDMPNVDLRDKASLQRGARTFMNYCSGCHGLEHLRYEQMARGIGLVDAEGRVMENVMKANLLFTADRVGDLMQTAMTKPQSAEWFGIKVPDLSLITKSRGSDWVYNYLLAFYPDASRPFGMNNAVFPDVAMPNVLVDVQGVQEPILHVIGYDDDNRPITETVGFELVEPGELTPPEFQQMIYDLTNFMVFASDPKKLQRERIGGLVIIFLVIFTAFAYMLKREYWKEVK